MLDTFHSVHRICSKFKMLHVGHSVHRSIVDKELEAQPVEHQEGHRDEQELGQQQTVVAQGGQ